MRHAEDFVNLGNRDDIEIFERTQESLAATPEIEWVDVSRGWGTGREWQEADGGLAGNIADETGIRSGYEHWRRLMSAGCPAAGHQSDFFASGGAGGASALVDQ